MRQLIASVQAGQAQDPIALTEAQERGFGVLMSLEAQLQRARRRPPEPGDPPVGSPDAEVKIKALADAIAELSDALTELRGLARPGGGPSRVGYGFVLPAPNVEPVRKPGRP
ncbi:MAG: hypothetical protein WBQ18_21380 [Solirubrobacteraceae bacterium]